MFKELGIIESYGTGIGEAKKACELNGSKSIYYKIFNDNANITSVVIPCSDEYLKITNQERIKKDSSISENENVNLSNKIKSSDYSLNTKNNLDKISYSFKNSIFSPKDIIELLNVSKNTATNYINKLKELNLLDKIDGLGQSKYKFK